MQSKWNKLEKLMQFQNSAPPSYQTSKVSKKSAKNIWVIGRLWGALFYFVVLKFYGNPGK